MLVLNELRYMQYNVIHRQCVSLKMKGLEIKKSKYNLDDFYETDSRQDNSNISVHRSTWRVYLYG